jgi:hypothetical protein
MDRLSKIVYYLVDNLYTNILSWVECESKRKAVGRVIWFQFGNSGTAPERDIETGPAAPTLSAKNAERVGHPVLRVI